MGEYADQIAGAARAVSKHSRIRPRVCLILGSGLAEVAALVENPDDIPYAKLPHFPQPGVAGHPGRLVLGMVRGVPLAAFEGRIHYYEGFTMRQIALPVYVAHALGADTLIVTNAAGAVNPAFKPGDIMALTDHLNFAFANPLIGADDALGSRFLEMFDAYDAQLRSIATVVARARGFELREGVYAMMTGPTYETPAEVRMLRAFGADAVGMSTVPEAIAARHARMRVLGLSVIANACDADARRALELTHEDVMRAVRASGARVRTIVEGVAEALRA